MTKAELVQFIRELTLESLDEDIVVEYLEDALEDFAKFSETLCDIELVEAEAAVASYTLSDHQFRILQAFYGDRELVPTSVGAMEARKDWRLETGSALAYVLEDEVENTYRLFPIPTASHGDFNWIYGEPFGLDFPDNALAILFTLLQDNTHDIPNWIAVILAYGVAEKVFSRPSVYQDLELAAVFKLFRDLLWKKAKIQ